MKRLIVNADDFGLTAKINQAITAAHKDGLISSATLMANGEAFAGAVDLSRQAPQLGIGVHLNLTEGRPVAPPSRISSLLNGQGFFARKPAGLWRAITLGRVSVVHIETELCAQIEKVRGAGISPTHLDSHRHVHAVPVLGRMTLRLARQYGIPAIRSVAEGWSAVGYLMGRFPGAKATVLRQRLNSIALAALSHGWRSQVGREGMACVEHFYGITPTGFLDDAVLREILRHLPDGTSELMCHPGFVDQALRQTPTRLLEQREIEFQALSQPGIKLLANDLGIELINYEDLAHDFHSRASIQ